MEIKERLLNARNKKGLSLREAGEKSGLTHTNIFRYEQGLPPTVYAVEKMANAYGVSPIYLAGWDKYMTKDETIILARKIDSLTTAQQEAIETLIDTFIKGNTKK